MNGYPIKMQKHEIDIHLEEDYVGGCHPGIVKALYEYFGDGYNIVPDTIIWHTRKQ